MTDLSQFYYDLFGMERIYELYLTNSYTTDHINSSICIGTVRMNVDC